MGENVSAGREGPNAQGAGRPLGTERDITSGVEANPGHHKEWMRRSGRSDLVEADVEEESSVVSKGAPVKPSILRHQDLLHSGAGVSTIAGGNFEGVVRDRIKAASFPYSPDAQPTKLAAYNMDGILKEQIVKRLVRGIYDRREVFAGDKFPKQRTLNDVARMTLLNGSYKSEDGGRLLEKVKSLLPVPRAAAQTKGKAQRVKK